MAIQTVKIIAQFGLSTTTIKLFSEGSDTVVDSQTATAGANDPSVYSADFTDVVTARYRVVLFSGVTPMATDYVTLLNASANYATEELQEPAKLANQEAMIATLATTDGKIDTLISRITSTLFDGITSLGHWLRLIGRKDAANATALSEYNTGGGAYSEGTDSLEAVADDACTVDPLYLINTTIASIINTTTFTLTSGIATDDAYNGYEVIVIDSDSSTTRTVGVIADYDGATKQVTLAGTPLFVIGVGDTAYILAQKRFDHTIDQVIVSSFNTAALNDLANTEIELVGVIVPGGGLQVFQGDDYKRDQFTFSQKSNENWADLTGATVILHGISVVDNYDSPSLPTIRIQGVVTGEGSSNQVIKFNTMTKSITDIPFGTYSYQLRATLSGGDVETLRYGIGKLEVVEEIRVPAP